MAKVDVNDRDSLRRAYPEEAFASDAARNEMVPNTVLHGVRIGSAPDNDGCFELGRAARHVGEPETADFLVPARRAEELIERGHHSAPTQVSEPAPGSGYERFLDDIVAAAGRVGFRAENSPRPGDARLRGLRQ